MRVLAVHIGLCFVLLAWLIFVVAIEEIGHWEPWAMTIGGTLLTIAGGMLVYRGLYGGRP